MQNTTQKRDDSLNLTKKYMNKLMWLTIIVFTNVLTLFLYDRYLSLHIKTVDMQRIIQDPVTVKKFLNKEINENQYAISLQKNLEVLETSLKRFLINEPNTLFLIKGAIIDVKGFKSNKIVDITDEVYRDIQTYSHK
jgi:hypothetical protein